MHITYFVTAGLAGLLISSGAATASQSPRGEPSADCSQYQNSLGDDTQVARAEEQAEVARAQVERISARTRNGGVLVVGWDRDVYSIKACKAAGGATMAEARSRLAAIALHVEQGAISVSEPPDGSSWVVHYIVHAPQDGAVQLRAVNGPLSVRDFAGTAELASQNGPIALARVSGQVTANAVNGPLSVAGSSGNITAHTQNGPVSVALADDHWQGEKLEASTQNGPVTINVPDGYQSGVEVRMGRNAPFQCASDACRSDASRTWDENGRKVVLGGGSPTVKLSTQNGPVTIGSSAR